MKTLIFIFLLTISACSSGFFGPGGATSWKDDEGTSAGCSENLDTCMKTCKGTHDGHEFERTFPLAPEKCSNKK